MTIAMERPTRGTGPDVPAPTRDLEQGLANIREHGFTIVPDVLTGDTLERTREALYREIAWDQKSRRHVPHPFDAQKSPNVRVWNLISKDPLFEDLAVHPVVLDYIREVIGWPARISTLSGNINYPGARACVLHADQIWAPEPWPSQGPLGINFGWCIDDFTKANGGTRIVPKSHRMNRLPRADDAIPEMISVEAPAGSLIVFESRLWHQTGDNVTDDVVRAAIFGFYQKPLYMPAENWFMQTKPEVVRHGSEDLLTLMGFRDPSLGHAD
ncbi:MAG: phytanoyl-CoA dioxygenase family protein [Alphaproteobacteria bacterium]|nr:phytanoyl-CoA dioxygenase family protein [Alphaproteobacteria bacterium]